MEIPLLVSLHLILIGVIATITTLYFKKKKKLNNELHFIKEALASIGEDAEASRLAIRELVPALAGIAPGVEKISAPQRRNDIEKKELEEIPLDESMRIPVIDGVNVKFENESRSYPINLIEYGEGI